MDEDDSGWDFVLIPNPSSAYKKKEKRIMTQPSTEDEGNPIKVRMPILCTRSL